ncbi:hypothetical protein FZEAL_7845 [Fusarium zealandicum]|uniref:Extracellular membrane protein CFEM domain-containing protein n=1 Tax=Fusarium zealandicum TaxID=1053134 RepID=A0A8H4XHE8_9HYPO|nr:hypothetical protein FZEAL_7845 [Fusarium zealandicum]
MLAISLNTIPFPIVSSLIPGCAEECLLSFLSVNYASTGCAGKLTLDCMCSRIGATGFTLGEGAFQCISAERSIGYCSDVDASDDVINNAYAMCNGRPHAINPSHRTITATLVLAPSGGVITFPPLKTTALQRTASSSTRTLPTTLVIDTSSPPELPISATASSRRTARRSTSLSPTEEPSSTDSSTLSISTANTFSTTKRTRLSSTLETSASTTETTAGASTEAADGAGKDDDEEDSDGLSTEQVAGISVGVLAAAGVAAGAIVLARYYRRKNYPKVKTGFLPMRDTWGYKPEQSGRGGHGSWMIHQMRPELDPTAAPPPPPPAYNRRSYKPNTIGLAMSPPPSSRGTAHPSPLRRISRLLPAKPTLPIVSSRFNKEESPPLLQPEWDDTEHHNAGPSSQSREDVSQLPPTILAVPAPAASPPRSKPMPPAPPKLHILPPNTVAPPASNNRESNVTEFEEDRTSLSPSTQVWRPPPTTPISATTFYVADQYGNWVLGNSKRASLIARGSQGSQASQEAAPKPPPKDNSSALGAGHNRAQSLAPPAEIIPAGFQPNERPAGPRSQHPSPFFSSQSHPRRNVSTRRSLTRPQARPREDSSSSSSATIITTSSEASSIPSMTQEQQVSLSPVFESPRSVRDRAPQPRIPPRDPRRMSQMSTRSDSTHVRSAPPTRQIVYSPPGQPSPTLGTMQDTSGSSCESIPNAGHEGTGSQTMRIVEPSPEPEEPGRTPAVDQSQIRTSPFYFDPPYPQPLNTRAPSQHHRSVSGPQTYRPYQRPPSQRPPSHHLSPQQQQAAWQPVQRIPPSYQSFQQQLPVQRQPPQQPQAYQPFQPRPGHYPYPRNPGYQPFQQQHQHQPPQQHEQHSQIHPSRAPYQNYRPSPAMNPPYSAHPGPRDSSLLAKRLGSDRAADMSIGTEPARASKWNRDSRQLTPQGLPDSPHWKPTLTPSRRGDDLFLNVQ